MSQRRFHAKDETLKDRAFWQHVTKKSLLFHKIPEAECEAAQCSVVRVRLVELTRENNADLTIRLRDFVKDEHRDGFDLS